MAADGLRSGIEPRDRERTGPLLTLGLLTALRRSASSSAFWLLDYFVIDAAHHARKGPFLQLLRLRRRDDAERARQLAQVIAAVLGIAITVVSIVVQLAANRYTSRVTDMFFRDRRTWPSWASSSSPASRRCG